MVKERSPAAVRATNGNDAIAQTGNTIAMNNASVVNFASYPTVNVLGLGGDDAVVRQQLHELALARYRVLFEQANDALLALRLRHAQPCPCPISHDNPARHRPRRVHRARTAAS